VLLCFGVLAWFEIEDERNSNVYVSGLPEDITLEEFKEFMTKVGVVAYDPIYRKPKLKLYANADGSFKGDGRCCYIKVSINQSIIRSVLIATLQPQSRIANDMQLK